MQEFKDIKTIKELKVWKIGVEKNLGGELTDYYNLNVQYALLHKKLRKEETEKKFEASLLILQEKYVGKWTVVYKYDNFRKFKSGTIFFYLIKDMKLYTHEPNHVSCEVEEFNINIRGDKFVPQINLTSEYIQKTRYKKLVYFTGKGATKVFAVNNENIMFPSGRYSNYNMDVLSTDINDIMMSIHVDLFDKFHELVKPLIDQLDKSLPDVHKEAKHFTLSNQRFVLKDLMDYCTEHNLTPKDIVEKGGKVARYNYFNSHHELSEFKSYKANDWDKGIYATVQGGNGGTDYEPYTTHYIIESIQIDWKHVLYPIRLSLKCTVEEAENKLKELNLDWDISYNTYGYDATFEYVKCNNYHLINELIKTLI